MQVTSESRARIDALKQLLEEGSLSTQDELREKLEKLAFSVTQSTVSRDLRKIGAIKAIDTEGRTVYRLPEDPFEPVVSNGLGEMIKEIHSNQSMIVIHTLPGSAQLVARHLDHTRPAEILGTIAGDDTVFVAPSGATSLDATLEAIRRAVGLRSSN